MVNPEKNSTMQCSSKIRRIAGVAREYLLEAKKKEESLLPNSYKALLMSCENAYYLKQLQKTDFNVFDKGLNKPFFFAVPLSVYRAARNRTFVNKIS